MSERVVKVESITSEIQEDIKSGVIGGPAALAALSVPTEPDLQVDELKFTVK